MAKPRMALTGQRFGRLVVLDFAEMSKHGRSLWTCRCECNAESRVVVQGGSLRSGNTTSCGCYSKSLRAVRPGRMKHGESPNRCCS